MRDRHTHLADLAAGELVIGVITGLGRQVERDRQARLPLGQVPAVKRVGFRRIGVTGIGPNDPRSVPPRTGLLGLLSPHRVGHRHTLPEAHPMAGSLPGGNVTRPNRDLDAPARP